MKKIIFLSFYILCFANLAAQQRNLSSLKGHVLDIDTEEHLPGVTVFIENTQFAVITMRRDISQWIIYPKAHT